MNFYGIRRAKSEAEFRLGEKTNGKRFSNVNRIADYDAIDEKSYDIDDNIY